jgi:hypothetical protein
MHFTPADKVNHPFFRRQFRRASESSSEALIWFLEATPLRVGLEKLARAHANIAAKFH